MFGIREVVASGLVEIRRSHLTLETPQCFYGYVQKLQFLRASLQGHKDAESL